MSTGRWDVFLSYGHEDAGWVGLLAGNLHRDGFNVLLYQWEAVGGDHVTGRLEEAIRASRSGALVVSPHSLSRLWVREEYEALLGRAVEDPAGRRVVPVLYREAEPPEFMANRPWVDFRTATAGPKYEAALEHLERYLRGDAAEGGPECGGARVWPASAAGPRVHPAVALRRVLVIEPDRVSLREDTTELAEQPVRLRQATIAAVKELHRMWPRGVGDRALERALADVGRRLTSDFVAGYIGVALADAVAQATRLNELLELGIQAPGLGEFPWELLLLPGPDGVVAAAGSTPLALHRNVALFRLADGHRAATAYKVRGPLRMLAVIASPESQDEVGELLNYEAELAQIVVAVDPARRRGDAHIRVLMEGSLPAIRSALQAEPEGFHVLHLSCHARPGVLILETPDGGEDAVSAGRLLEEGLPKGVDLPMVMLSGCSTGIGAGERANDQADGEGERALRGVAQQLLDAGVPIVLAMRAPVG